MYCRDTNRTGDHEHTQFDFLSYRFQPRKAKNRWGKQFTAFLPAISRKAMKAIVPEIRDWGLHRISDKELEDLSRALNPKIRGWITYFGRYYPTALRRVFRHLNWRLVRWAQRKYKRFRTHQGRTWHYLRQVAQGKLKLFAHWEIGILL